MIVYKVFLCMAVMHGACTMADPPRHTFMGYFPGESYDSLGDCKRAAHAIDPYPNKNMHYECFGKNVDTWEQATSRDAPEVHSIPKAPDAFAWRKGKVPPAGVEPDADGMPKGYEIHSGMTHNCFAPDCLWFERVK